MPSITKTFKTFKASISKKLKRNVRKESSAPFAHDVFDIGATKTVTNEPVAVVSVSATGEGLHTRWVYQPQITGSPASSVTFLGSVDEEPKHSEKLIIRIPASRKISSLRFPASKQRSLVKTRASDASAPSRLIYNGVDASGVPVTVTTTATGKGVHIRWNCEPSIGLGSAHKEKLAITIPASKKRACPTDDDDDDDNSKAVFVRRTRARRTEAVPFPPCAIITPTEAAGELLFNGISNSGQPVVVSTSATGQGTHTRFLYSNDSDVPCDGIEADDEASSDSGSSTITVPQFKGKGKSLKRGRGADDENDEGSPARRTRSRLSKASSLSSSSSFSLSSSSSTDSSSSSASSSAGGRFLRPSLIIGYSKIPMSSPTNLDHTKPVV